MPIISTFCKKGGVGKTTFLGYLAHFYANQGKTVSIKEVMLWVALKVKLF